jgi:hypothetical protein
VSTSTSIAVPPASGTWKVETSVIRIRPAYPDRPVPGISVTTQTRRRVAA